MTGTKSKTRAKTSGKKKTASKTAGRKKTTARKTTGRRTTGKKTAKSASRRGATKQAQHPDAGVATMTDPADPVTMHEPEDLVDMMQVPEFPAPDAALDRVFNNGTKAKPRRVSRRVVKDEFAAWSTDPDQNPRHVGLAIRGHVSRPFRAGYAYLVRLPAAVSIAVCFLGGFALGWIARSL